MEDESPQEAARKAQKEPKRLEVADGDFSPAAADSGAEITSAQE